MLSGFFGGKKPAETPPSVGASYGSGADGTGTRAPASSAMGASGGASRTKSSGGNGKGNPDDIPDGDMAALFERCQDLLAKTMKRADIGAKTPEDESRQFLRLNMIKRLMARLCDGLETPGNLDAGEKLAWAAQLEFLEEEVAAAVEKVTGMAHERDPPTPKHGTQNTAVSAPNSAPANESLGAMFAGMDVGGATPAGMGPTAVPGNVLTPSPLPSGGIAGGDLFSGLDLTPGAAEATLPVRPSPGGVAGLGMLDESLFGGALVAEVPPAPEPSVEETTTNDASAPTPEVNNTSTEPPGGKQRRRGKVRVGYARDDDGGGGGGGGDVPTPTPELTGAIDNSPGLGLHDVEPHPPPTLDPTPASDPPETREPEVDEPPPAPAPPTEDEPSHESTADAANALLAAVAALHECETEATRTEQMQMDLCEQEDFDGAEALNETVDNLNERARRAATEAVDAEARFAAAFDFAVNALERDAEMSVKRASALEAEAAATRTSERCDDDDHGVRDARARRDAAAEERDVIREASAMANEAVKDAIDGKTASVENSMEFIKVARAESDADYAREESARLEKEVDLLRAALSAKETEYADALQAMIAALETEGRAQAALKAISGDADAVVVEAEAEATALSTEFAAAEDKASEASRALDAAETAKEKAAADANRRADEAAAAAKEVKDAAASAAAAARRMRNAAVLVADARAEETAANEAFRRLETDVEAASVAAVAASVTRSQSTMDKAIGSTPESLRKSAAVRRAESEELAAEAETEEDAKKLAAASKDFKTAATKSRRAKDLRERAAAAASEAEEMEASAAEMATKASAAAKEGAGDEAGKEDEKEALSPTEVFRALNAKLKAAEVESWRARRRRVLAESGLEPEDSPASCALRAVADVLEKRIARREAEIAEDAE